MDMAHNNQATVPPPPDYDRVVKSTSDNPPTLDQLVSQALELDDADFEMVIDEALKNPHRPSNPPPLPPRSRMSNPMLHALKR